MNNEKYKRCIFSTVTLLKKLARKARAEANNAEESSTEYAEGVIMGYYSIITLLKHEAFAFCIDQKELGLEDISPDTDLLGLVRNHDVDFGENNWPIDVINEEKIKGYFSDSITLLKEQAKKAKIEADSLKEDSKGYNKGELKAYRSVFSLFKNQAHAFNIDEDELGLADIEPEIDLI